MADFITTGFNAQVAHLSWCAQTSSFNIPARFEYFQPINVTLLINSRRAYLKYSLRAVLAHIDNDAPLA